MQPAATTEEEAAAAGQQAVAGFVRDTRAQSHHRTAGTAGVPAAVAPDHLSLINEVVQHGPLMRTWRPSRPGTSCQH